MSFSALYMLLTGTEIYIDNGSTHPDSRFRELMDTLTIPIESSLLDNYLNVPVTSCRRKSPYERFWGRIGELTAQQRNPLIEANPIDIEKVIEEARWLMDPTQYQKPQFLENVA